MWQGSSVYFINPVTVSVSSADRVWVWQHRLWKMKKRQQKFQYPRRIECGCGPRFVLARVGQGVFQYPRRIECGCGTEVLTLYL